MTLRDALLLGRVSNLPTVWTNLLAGAVLSGAVLDGETMFVAGVALTLFYVGGMYLNDAFDAAIDAVERPERPIPNGRVSRTAVFAWGFGMLAAGIAVLAVLGHVTGRGWLAAAGGVALAGAIVLYNVWHKGNPLSPFIMGLCRMLVYVVAAWCFTTTLPADVLLGAAIVLSYLIGLTYVAKQENLGAVANMWPLLFLATPLLYALYAGLQGALPALGIAVLLALWIGVALRFVLRAGPGDIPRAVVSLIAGISLVDALLIATAGELTWLAFGVVGFILTLALQKLVPGT
ncbi:MAG: UbiA family prenyltransferase [Pseudomonadota bacterium]